jgi:myo-inositol 2-dehydrogenase/D-chiro-inositol 1-dehydrogenase
MLRFALFGAGRIGKIHAGNIARHPRASLSLVVDINKDSAHELAKIHGADAAEEDAVFNNPDIDAVLIASATDTHADLISKAAKAGKAIFCEKPVHLDVARVEACLDEVARANVTLLVGFNRRYDPSFAALKNEINAGKIGKVEMVTITSRDPSPPPASYIKVSGGIFRDMTIHDFDMARWLLGEEPVEVFATGSCQVDPAIGQAGDIDTATIILKTASGKLCQISNSRRASYGYDQRIEVHGEKGMLQAGNVTATTVVCADASGVHNDKPVHFFLERYAEAYRMELEDFITAVESKSTPRASGFDGLAAQRLADAAQESLQSGQAVRLDQKAPKTLAA